MKKNKNPFAGLDPQQLDKALEARRCGPDFSRSGLNLTFTRLLLGLRDANTKSFRKWIRQGKVLSVMRLTHDRRFFSRDDAENIRKVYRETLGKAIQPILDKDIRKLDQADDRIIRAHFPKQSLIPLHIFAASVLIDQSGVMEPTIEDLFHLLKPGARRAIAHAVQLLTQKPGLQRTLERSVRRFARNEGVQFGD